MFFFGSNKKIHDENKELKIYLTLELSFSLKLITDEVYEDTVK